LKCAPYYAFGVGKERLVKRCNGNNYLGKNHVIYQDFIITVNISQFYNRIALRQREKGKSLSLYLFLNIRKIP
jgi:hypothetical protein